MLFTRSGKMTIKNAKYAEDPSPIEPGCPCYTCRYYSRAYLRHLYFAEEILAFRLNTVHNLYFYLAFMQEMRAAIAADRLDAFRQDFTSRWESSLEPGEDSEVTSVPTGRRISLSAGI
jgi:queuine tRNA-ribosyltransferase